MVKIARICIYPFKSLDGMGVEQAELLTKGAIQHDRLFALKDHNGNFLNAKRSELFHLLEARYDLDHHHIEIKKRDQEQFERFDLKDDIPELEKWFSEYFKQELTLSRNSEEGFPDDTDSPGPTIISKATLETVAKWFEIPDLDEVRKRFRANIEIDGCEPFWEDQLYSELDHVVRFQMGEIEWLGVNPCARCVVPSRSSITGERMSAFQKRFANYRQENITENVSRSRWNHFYRLAVNTKPVHFFDGGTIKVGDELKILGPESETN